MHYKTVGIVGGGTAGYLSALALRKAHPQLEVTLIESPAIPIIGVGEATTPTILTFLHEFLGFDREELYREVKPTWKLGIRFFWGKPGDYAFNNPFGLADILPAWRYGENVDLSSAESVLMAAEKSPVLLDESAPGGYRSLLDHLSYAYHLDNALFVAYLRKKAAEAGVIHLERKITGARRHPELGDIAALLTEEGGELSYDLYVDCSGFRSLLIEQVLGSRFIDFRSSLYTDTAVVANVGHGGAPPPYTMADSMHCGWTWGIPLRDEIHRGYVFSSDFCSVDEAYREMQARNPGLSDYRVVRFRSGRHEDFWKNNVVAIGNAYGFVEPLESTGIHMILESIKALVEHFPYSAEDRAVRRLINQKMNAQWDYLRWFLALHYRFNRKFNSLFWKTCRAKVDLGPLNDLVDLYRERGSLFYQQLQHPDLFAPLIHDEIFGAFGLDVMLLGQGVLPGRKLEEESSEQDWRERLQSWSSLAGRALHQLPALEVLNRHPELLLRDNSPPPE